MTLVAFFNLFKTLRKLFGKPDEPMDEPNNSSPTIVSLHLVPNPRYANLEKLWGYRPTSYIEKLIVHQALGEVTTVQVHEYHISPQSHLKLGVGAPKICYHYTIEKDGRIYHVNDDTSIVWHCRGQNMRSIGILVCGDFGSKNHKGKSHPTKEQIESLDFLLGVLRMQYRLKRKDVYGHNSFGKEACPGDDLVKFIDAYKIGVDV